MKNFRCGDIVPGCTRTFTGTQEDILTEVARHAHIDHGMTALPSGFATQVQAAMTPAPA